VTSADAAGTPSTTPPTSKRRWRRPSAGTLAKEIVLIAAVFIVLLPTLFVILTALKTQADYSFDKIGFPAAPTLDNVETAMRGGRFGLWFVNSILLAFGSTAISLMVAAPAAFAFSRMRFKGQTLLLALVTALMVIPPVVLILPLFILLTRVGLTSSLQGVMLVYAGLLTPFSVFLLTSFFRAVPNALIESASIDGAASHTVLLRIMLPLTAPAMATLVVVNSLYVWNDLLIALVLLPRDELRTLMVGVTIFGSRYNSDVPVAMMGMLLASLPMLLVYIVAQRFFIRGLASGGLKG
jgi:ABC-type glycerol-3-phosphate transport system permease component